MLFDEAYRSALKETEDVILSCVDIGAIEHPSEAKDLTRVVQAGCGVIEQERSPDVEVSEVIARALGEITYIIPGEEIVEVQRDACANVCEKIKRREHEVEE